MHRLADCYGEIDMNLFKQKAALTALASGVLLIAATSAAGTTRDVYTSDGSGNTRAQACTWAKHNASMAVSSIYRADVSRYGDCACDQSRSNDWVCTVDAYFSQGSQRSASQSRPRSAPPPSRPAPPVYRPAPPPYTPPTVYLPGAY